MPVIMQRTVCASHDVT